MSIRISQKVADSIRNDSPNRPWKQYADGRQLVQSIKALRAIHPGLGLKEAKDAVEIYMHGGSLNDVEIYGHDDETEIYTVPNGQFHIIKDASGYRAEFRQTTGYFSTRHRVMQEVIDWATRF
jgi:hypothetical protein